MRTAEDLPPAVRELVAGRVIRLAWENEVGGLTFEVTAEGGPVFLKWSPASAGIDLAPEAERLRWAATFAPVPTVLGEGRADGGSWMVTAALPGESAVSPTWKAQPDVAVAAIGASLRQLHDTLPVATCPFSWSIEERVADAQRRRPDLDPARWHPEHQILSVDEAFDILASPPAPTGLVVCHGDACAPNTLLTDDGRFSGHVDLGDLGVADPWADLAIATWSAGWNYGPGWEDLLLSAYGTTVDLERTRYYRLLYDLGP